MRLVNMALARLSMKFGKVGKAAAHAAYIAREAPYAGRLNKGERLEAKATGNLPAWAEDQPNRFWQAADAYERANGTTYREMEIALPRELTPAQRLALVRGFVLQELGTRHAYQWAIHNPKAADGHEQPHVHLMFSERRADGIERDPSHYFRRYNPKAPEQGGARKGYGPYGGGYLSPAERVAHLKGLRQRWEIACNTALAQAGHAERIDLRSHTERGLTIPPERKQLPSEWRRPEIRAAVLAFRQARAAHAEAQAEVAHILPDPSAAILQLKAERQRQAEAAERQRQAEEAVLLALKDAKTALLAEIPTWADAGVLDYVDRVMAQNQTVAEQRAGIHQDLTQTLIHDVTRRGHPPALLPVELFEAAAEDCLGPMVARCRQARTERERHAEITRQAEAAEAERQRQAEAEAEAEAEEQRIRQAEETERQRRADEAEQAQRQRDAERQVLLRADIPALEREWSEWTRYRERLARHEPQPAAWLADQWGEREQAQRATTAAEQALDALEAAYADWRQVHKLGLLLMAGLPGSRRREVPAWEQRIAAARATLEHAQAALAVAQEAYNARLPAAEREARQLAEDGRRQSAALQRWIEARAGLIQRAKAAQEAERERLNAEARARAEVERQQREAEQGKIQEPECPPPAPKQEPPKLAIPAPRPKPRYRTDWNPY